MLFALTQIIFVLLPKTLLANYSPASGSQHPHVVPSPSVSHGRSTSAMQEKECFVARMCEYKILENFSCKVSKYKISNGVDRTLPKWLWFDEKNQTIKGIPSPADEGLSEILITGLNRHLTGPVDYICGLLTVKINVWNVKYFPLFAQNVPTSPVIDNKVFKPSSLQGFICQFNEPIVLASLVLAGNFHEMAGEEKINVLDELLQSYHISIYDVFTLPNNGDSLSSLLHTSHVLASGPGANRSASGLSTIVTWHVRCGVMHLDDALFTALEKLSRQLTIINNVGYAPVGWHVVTGFRRQHVRRRRNVAGTTTLEYSTVPISRATVITTKIKITKTTYVTATRTLTRPLPTFSSPYTAKKTSLYNQSSTISSAFNNMVTPTQYNSVSSTSSVMSLPNTVSSLSQIISPSEISQYKNVSSTLLPVLSSSGSISSPSRISTLEIKNLSVTKVFSVSPLSPSGQRLKTSMSGSDFSTLPVISQTRNKSAILQVSSSNPIETSSQIDPTSMITGMNSSSFTSQLQYSKLGTLVQSSLTASTIQKSTYVIVPLSRNITPSVPSAVQTVLNNTSISSTILLSLKTISSLVIRSLFSSQQYLTPTAKFSIISDTTTMSKATQLNNSTATLLQQSYSDLIDRVSQSTSTAYSPVLHITTSKIISETKSTNVNRTLYESSNAYTRSVPSILTTPLTSSVMISQKSSTTGPSYVPYTLLSRSSLLRSRKTPSLFLSCTSSCLVSIFSKNLNFTLASGEQQYTTTLYQASVITSKTSLSSSRITETMVVNTRSVTQQTSEYVDKTSKSSVLISRIISKSLQSSDYMTFKTLTTTRTKYPSRLSSEFGKTIPSSSTGAMTSQHISGSRARSTMKTRFTGKTVHITSLQSSSEHLSSFSPVSSTGKVYSPTEQLRSTLSSPIKPTSTNTLEVTKTMGSGSLITNIVLDHSVSSLLTSHISGTFSSYITRSDGGDYSMNGTSDHSAFQTRSPSILSLHTVSFSSLATFSSSSNKDFKMSTLSVLKTTSSPVVPSFNQTPTTAFSTIFLSRVVSSYHTPTLSPITISTLSSSDVLFYPTATSQSVIVSTPSSHQLSSYTTSPLSTFATLESSSFLPSSHTVLTASTLTSVVDVFASSSVYASYRTLSLTDTITFSLPFLSSYNTGTSPSFGITTIIPSSHQLLSYTTSPLSTFAAVTPSFLPLSHTASALTSVVDVFASSSVYASYRALSTDTATFSFHSLSSYNTGTSRSYGISTTIPSSLFISYHTHTSPLSFFTISLSSSYHSSTSLSSLVNITASSDVLSRTTGTSQPSYLLSRRKRTFVNTITSSYHTVASPSFLSVYLSSYHTPTSPLNLGTFTPSSGIKSSITPFLKSQIGSTTTSSPLSYSPITFSPDYFSSRLTSQSRATISHLSDLLSSYHTQSFVATITPSSSYHTPTSPLSPGNTISSLYHSLTVPPSVGIIISSVNLSSSYNAVLSSFSPTIDKSFPSNLHGSSPTTLPLTSHKTFSLSFLSSSIVSSKPSISFDLSTGSSKSDTFTKSSLKTSWLVRPSYTWQSPHTTTVILTLTSVRIPVTFRSGVNPSFTSSRSSSTVVTRPTAPSRESPKIYNNFDLLRVTVGEVFSVQIPVDTFHDREDGNTRNLRLECLTVSHARLSSNSWLQFNSTTQTLYGLVLKSQLETIPSEYLLSASDYDGNTVYDAFTVTIEESSKVLAAMFSVELAGINLEMFNRDINNVLSMVLTIAGYYGDTDESMIQVLSLMEGSVIFTWSNTSLQTCDKYLIDDVASKIITREGNVQQDFYNALSPRYIADNVFVNYTGPCVVPSTENPNVTELSSHETSPWLKYFLPLLAVVVVIVVIVVIFLLVKRRSGVKILKEDKHTFKSRKPIILDDEQEMSTLCRKPVELPEDSLSPIRFPRESSLGTPAEYDEDDISELPSPILPAPSYQRLPPRYNGQYNRYSTPPPPYKLPPSY